MKIYQNTHANRKKCIYQVVMHSFIKLIQIRGLIGVIFSLILFQNVLAGSESSFAYCGKTVVCQGDHTCTMIDGDYQLFKSFAVGNHFNAGSYPLNKVIIWNSFKSQRATCFYSTPDDMVVQFVSLPNVRFGIGIYHAPSEGWIYDDPDSVPSSGTNIWACNGSKFECRIEHII